LSNEHTHEADQTYRIGAVSRLTGVPPDTLRVWERRYGVVTPMRTPSGTRLYGPEDVGRLSLIKQLVDRGDAISRVAGLSMDQLKERVRDAALPSLQDRVSRPCRVVVLGADLSARLGDLSEQSEGMDIVGRFRDAASLREGSAALKPDVLLAEYPTIHLEQVREIAELMTKSGAARMLVVYNFATGDTLDRLDARGIVPRRGPVDAAELRRWCLMAHATTLDAYRRPDEETGLDLTQPVPPRRFDDASLRRVAAISTAVRCECPHHLADLIGNLSAFERYSEECEVRHADDAVLHRFLYAITAQARMLMETALERVLDAEGIELDAQEQQPEDSPPAPAAKR